MSEALKAATRRLLLLVDVEIEKLDEDLQTWPDDVGLQHRHDALDEAYTECSRLLREHAPAEQVAA